MKLLLESLADEMTFIHEFFEKKLDTNSALAYADWLQEYGHQEELGIAVASAINHKRDGSKQLLHDKYMSIVSTHPITIIYPIFSSPTNTWNSDQNEFFLDGHNYNGRSVPPNKTLYWLDANTHEWGKYTNKNLMRVHINRIGPEDFDKIEVNQVPDHILQYFFFSLLHQWVS